MARRNSRNTNYTTGFRPSGIYNGVVAKVNGNLVDVKIPRIGLENVYFDCPIIGPTPSVGDNIFVGFIEGQSSTPVAFTSNDVNTGDIDSVVAGTALSGGGSSGDVTLNFAPSELSSATVSTSDKIVIADADDSDNPKTVTVQSIVDLSPGDITGVTAGTGISGGGTSGSVTVNFAPSELSSVTVATDDKVVIADTSDSDNPKHVTAQSIANLAASTPGGSTSQIQYNNSGSFAGSANFTFDGTSTITLTDTTDSSDAAPIIELYRNSASPADADYLGQIKFQGENDADQKVVYAKLTGKIDDASDTTEDGILELMLKKAGANNIAMRFTSTDMKLINGTGLEVDGDVTVDTDTLHVDTTDNRVGIGTTSPVAGLHIEGFSDADLSSTNHYIQLGATSGDNLRLDNNEIMALNNGSADTLYLQNDGGILAVGTNTDNKVGIGTNSPVAGLDIATTAGDQWTTNGWDSGIILNAASALRWREAGGVNYGIGNSGGTLYFMSSTDSGTGAAADYRMVIDSSGQVGINDTSPSYKLDVNGTARFTDQVYVQSILNVTNDLKVDTDTLFVDVSADRVGINDSTPSYSLDVAGTIRATADIYANDEIYVGANGGGDSPIHFYDDNSNTWRTFRWDDSSNEFLAEQNNGSSYPIWTQYRFRGGSDNVAVNSSGYGTIAHGLPSTPSFAFVTSYTTLSSDNDNQLAFPVTGVDSTNITFRAYEINGNGNSNYTSSTIYSATVYVYFLAAVM
tara:strand:+ start:14746 stop:16977 length:2232 start_codon:yes stop_codon:yes gene_type:complete